MAHVCFAAGEYATARTSIKVLLAGGPAHYRRKPNCNGGQLRGKNACRKPGSVWQSGGNLAAPAAPSLGSPAVRAGVEPGGRANRRGPALTLKIHLLTGRRTVRRLNGSDTNPGTKERPWPAWKKPATSSAVSPPGPATTRRIAVYLREASIAREPSNTVRLRLCRVAHLSGVSRRISEALRRSAAERFTPVTVRPSPRGFRARPGQGRATGSAHRRHDRLHPGRAERGTCTASRKADTNGNTHRGPLAERRLRESEKVIQQGSSAAGFTFRSPGTVAAEGRLLTAISTPWADVVLGVACSTRRQSPPPPQTPSKSAKNTYYAFNLLKNSTAGRVVFDRATGTLYKSTAVIAGRVRAVGARADDPNEQRVPRDRPRPEITLGQTDGLVIEGATTAW